MQLQKSGHYLRRIRADGITRRKLVNILICSVSFVLLSYFIAKLFVPFAFIQFHGNQQCPDNISTLKGFCSNLTLDNHDTWDSFVPNVSRWNSFLLIGFNARKKPNEYAHSFSFELGFRPSLTEATDKFTPLSDPLMQYDSSVTVNCRANHELCSPNVVMIYNEVNHHTYLVNMDLFLTDLNKKLLTSLEFFVMAQNKTFSIFMVVFRYILLGISVVFGAIYVFFYFMINPEDRTFEHRWILYLSILLVFFNDPFFAATLVNSRLVFAIFSDICTTMYISALLLFWSAMLPHIYEEGTSIHNRKFTRLTKILAGIFCVVLLSVTIIASYITRFDPSFHFGTKHPVILTVLYYVLFLFVIAAVVVIAIRMYKIYTVWPEVLTRHRLFLFLSVFYVMVILSFVVSGIYQPFEIDAPKIVMLFFLSNVYIIALQIYWRFDDVSLKPKLFTNAEGEVLKEVLQANKLAAGNEREENENNQIHDIEAINKELKNIENKNSTERKKTENENTSNSVISREGFTSAT